MSIDSNLPCQKKAPLTPQPKSYSTFPKSLISVHHCLFGLFCSKENWLTWTLRSRSRWVVRHWAAPSEKADIQVARSPQSKTKVNCICFLSYSRRFKPCHFQPGPDRVTTDQQIRRIRRWARCFSPPSVIAVSRATICQATLSFQGKSWAQNDIIAWLGEVWTHNPCWTRSHMSVMSWSLCIASGNGGRGGGGRGGGREGEWTREKGREDKDGEWQL